MYVNNSLLGSVVGSLFGRIQQPDAHDHGPRGRHGTEEPSKNTVSEPGDSGAVRFDLSPAVTGQADSQPQNGTGGGQNPAEDEAALAAYFYAAKWAQSTLPKPGEISASDETPVTGSGEKFSFATEPYRRDIVQELFPEHTVRFMGKTLATFATDGKVTMGDSNAASQPFELPKSHGSF